MFHLMRCERQRLPWSETSGTNNCQVARQLSPGMKIQTAVVTGPYGICRHLSIMQAYRAPCRMRAWSFNIIKQYTGNINIRYTYDISQLTPSSPVASRGPPTPAAGQLLVKPFQNTMSRAGASRGNKLRPPAYPHTP